MAMTDAEKREIINAVKAELLSASKSFQEMTAVTTDPDAADELVLIQGGSVTKVSSGKYTLASETERKINREEEARNEADALIIQALSDCNEAITWAFKLTNATFKGIVNATMSMAMSYSGTDGDVVWMTPSKCFALRVGNDLAGYKYYNNWKTAQLYQEPSGKALRNKLFNNQADGKLYEVNALGELGLAPLAE